MLIARPNTILHDTETSFHFVCGRGRLLTLRIFCEYTAPIVRPLIRSRNQLLSHLSDHPLNKTIFGVFVVCGIIISAAMVYFSASRPYRSSQTLPSDLQRVTNTTGLTAIAAKHVDSLAPQVRIDSPTDGATLVSDSQESINVIASDNSRVSRIDIWVDSLLLKTCRSKTSCQVMVQVNGLMPGVHTVKATAKDASGNTASTQVIVNK